MERLMFDRKNFDREWLSPRKLTDYYLEWAEPPIADIEKELYRAVINGEVRSRSKGIVHGPEWLKQIDKRIFNPDNRYALPPDIGISVSDAKRKWNIRK
jgi:hypothetical protein